MAKPPRPCIQCGKLTRGTRCPTCTKTQQSERNARRTHYHGTWQADSKQARAAHIEQHGHVCPGYNRPAHPATDLELDHTTGLVLCHTCNVHAGPAGH